MILIFNNLTEYIAKALRNKDDRPSSMRVMSFYLVLLSTSVLCFGFIYVVLFIKEYIIEYAAILSGLITAVLLAKRSEKKLEVGNE